MKKYVDLHIHSTFSDGQYSPSSIINIAKKNDVGLISITDHDNIESAKQIRSLNRDNIKFVNGVEISSLTSIDNVNHQIHILGYGYDEQNILLNQALNERKNIRIDCNRKYVDQMIKELLFINSDIKHEIDFGKYIAISRAIIKALETKKITSSQWAVVKEYLCKIRPEYPGYDFSEKEAVGLILDSGGYPVLAHPYQYGMSEMQERKLIIKLLSYGLMGIELYHSGDSKEGVILQKTICNDFGLLWTVGSDFHADYDDFGNQIGFGKNNNLRKNDCTLIRTLKKDKKIIGR